MSLDERSESLNIRTSNGVERRVRIIQDPGMIFFPTMNVYGIQVGQGEKKFATLDYDNGEGEYKTIFEWRFSVGSIDILPQ